MRETIIKPAIYTIDILKKMFSWLLVSFIFIVGVWSSDLILETWEIFKFDGVYLIGQHIELVIYSGGAAILIGVPLGIFLSRPKYRKIADTIMQGLNIGSAIPTLAVIALSMSFLGIGAPPAIFALTIASLLPIVRNTYTGMTSISESMLEAANGLGMTKRDILFRIEIPNAAYVIFAGIRTALAINVGTVPLAFLIGGGGLGELIFSGIDLNDPAMLLAGAIPTALLAMAVDTIVTKISILFISKGVQPVMTE